MDFPDRVQYVAQQLGITADEVRAKLMNAPEDKTVSPNKDNIPSFVDFTVLYAYTTAEDIKKLCKRAKEVHSKSVCVNPCRVALAKQELAGTDVRIASVIGFPLGATTAASKAFESVQAVAAGADELDMVIDIGALIDGDYKKVVEDIAEMRKFCPLSYIKCIIETCYLTREQIIDASILTVVAGADNVKTSTGFGKPTKEGVAVGATVENVRLMRQVVGPKFGVKAAGGVRTKDQAHAVIEAGATRIGASSPALFE